MTKMWKDWRLVPLRIAVGFGFASHGYAKLSRGPDGFAVILAALHVPAPQITAWLTSLLEFVGGASIMAGAFVALLAIPLSAIMLTAMLTVHWQYGFSSVRLKAITTSGAEFGPIGYELNLLYIVALVALAFSPTALSVDRWLRTSAGRQLTER